MDFILQNILELFLKPLIRIIFICLVIIVKSEAQVYYGQGSSPPFHIYEITIDESQCGCNVNNCACNAISIVTPDVPGFDVTFCPNGQLYLLNDEGILQFDFATGVSNLVYPIAIDQSIYSLRGLVCANDSIMYLTMYVINGSNQWLYSYNINSGSFTNLGLLPDPIGGDMALFQGNIYGSHWDFVLVDTDDPENSSSIDLNYFMSGITASSTCNRLLGVDAFTNLLYAIDLLDLTVTPICTLPEGMIWITSMQEFIYPDCTAFIDLDCDDSSGAVDADYNAPSYDCFSNGAVIADEDIKIRYDALISSMTIQVAGNVPDFPFEILDMTGNVPGINASGLGTGMITLTNAGTATSTDFKDALHLIIYENYASPLTGGPRTIEVQFTTESGAMSNVATAFIQVNELPILNVDLGPDQEACDGASFTFDAGNPGATFVWSNGQQTQTITVNQTGQYIVTVDDGVFCPTRDTVQLNIIPVINVTLTGDIGVCENGEATLTLSTDSPFPLDVVISAVPGSPISLNDITDDFDFAVEPLSTTLYTITSITPSQPGCIEIPDPVQTIEVYPNYNHDVDVTLCDGDSIWLAYYWEKEEGLYDIYYNSQYGCDSLVNVMIDVLPVEYIYNTSATCDPASAGVFITYLDNPNGCDTIVETTITLLGSDTTTIALTTCNSDSTGVSMMLLNNQSGCDSLIITTVSLIPPTDTTWLTETTCDSNLLGIYQLRLTDQAGCDSLVITSIQMAPADTTYLYGVSCDTSVIGVSQNLLTNQSGCDSLVITTIIADIPDTTDLSTSSCDSASLGVFETHYINLAGCDSVVFTTISYSASDSTFINGSHCDPGQTGVTIQHLLNRFGCDSIVTTTITLLPSDMVSIASTTCDPSVAGIFTFPLINQYGCDSIVTETITLLPSDETFITGTTCLSSEAGMFITTHFNQYGCDSIVTLTVTLLLSDTTQIQYSTCDPGETGSIQNLYTGQDGCDSLVIETTTLNTLPELIVLSANDYNGFDVSCEGGADGGAIASVNGVPPYTFLWSTSDTDQMISGLSAGDYAVAITDGNGCMTSGEITLTQPEILMIGFEITEPGCFEQQQGSITVLQVGGVGPYTYSIDGAAFQSSPNFTGLPEGIYQITTRDANDCEVKEIIAIDVPLLVQVDLGDNQVISLGDSAQLQAVINLPFDSLSSLLWTGIDTTDCANCLTQIVAPIITTAYSVSVTSVDGCADSDSLTVFVATGRDIYIPNIFSPNGDGINDVLMISAGGGVKEISSLSIFDRWGNMVFSAEHILPDDPAVSWDGKMKGEVMNPGVFTYRIVVGFDDGRSEVRYGDVTLMR